MRSKSPEQIAHGRPRTSLDQDPPHVIRDPRRNDLSEIQARKEPVPAKLGWHRYWESPEWIDEQRLTALTR